MSKIRTVIIDDEAPARSLIRHLLKSQADIEVVGEAAEARRAIDIISSENPDLVFLDIQLGADGAFSIVQKIGTAKMPLVIFVTAHRKYAADAFEIAAVDYLLKPIDPDRFREALSRARERLILQKPETLKRMLSNSSAPADKTQIHIGVREGNRRIVVRVRDILWLKADGNYVNAFHLTSKYRIRRSISAIESAFPSQFFRIHRSIVVNLDYAREIVRLPNGQYRLILKDGTKLNLSRKYQPGLQQRVQTI